MLFRHIFCICYILSCLDCKVLVQLFFRSQSSQSGKLFYHACFYLSAAVFVFIGGEAFVCACIQFDSERAHVEKNDSSCHSCRNFQCKRIMF